MLQARPLPAYLISRFQGWKATTYQDNKAWYRRLAAAGRELMLDLRREPPLHELDCFLDLGVGRPGRQHEGLAAAPAKEVGNV